MIYATVAQLVEQRIRNDTNGSSVFQILFYKSFLIPQNIQWRSNDETSFLGVLMTKNNDEKKGVQMIPFLFNYILLVNIHRLYLSNNGALNNNPIYYLLHLLFYNSFVPNHLDCQNNHIAIHLLFYRTHLNYKHLYSWLETSKMNF